MASPALPHPLSCTLACPQPCAVLPPLHAGGQHPVGQWRPGAAGGLWGGCHAGARRLLGQPHDEPQHVCGHALLDGAGGHGAEPGVSPGHAAGHFACLASASLLPLAAAASPARLVTCTCKPIHKYLRVQIRRPRRHLVVWHHAAGAGARPRAVCAPAAHEGAADDHPEPAAHAGHGCAWLGGLGVAWRLPAFRVAWLIGVACLRGDLAHVATVGFTIRLSHWAIPGWADPRLAPVVVLQRPARSTSARRCGSWWPSAWSRTPPSAPPRRRCGAWRWCASWLLRWQRGSGSSRPCWALGCASRHVPWGCWTRGSLCSPSLPTEYVFLSLALCSS